MMSDERDSPDPKMVALIVEAVSRQVANVGRREVVDTPPALTGVDAGALRKTINTILDEELSRRRVLSDPEIRDIARDVAKTVFKDLSEPIAADVRKHLTEQQIEELVYDKISDLGLPAESREERKATKEIVEALLRGHKLRTRIGSSFIEEITKAFAAQLIGGGVIAGIIYAAMKAGAHP